MQSAEIFEADDFFELIHRSLEGGRGAQVVTASESMTCVETDANAVLVVRQSDDVSQVFERASENVAAGSHVLEDRDNRRRGLVSSVDVGSEMGDGSLTIAPGRVSSARVEVVQLNAEPLATLQVVKERFKGLLCPSFVCMGQIDKIRAMRKHVFGLIIRVRLAVGME
jgi:hypothetical protein